jgi:hypothetical protein
MFQFVCQQVQHSDLSVEKIREAVDNLFDVTLDELTIAYSIFQMRPARYYAGEILRGAHVQIFDDGRHYEQWKALPSADQRGSSHRSDGPQYHVDGPFVHTVLFGKLHKFYSWFQLEAHPVGFSQVLFHAWDFLKYSSTHENQGPYGSSPHTDAKPLYWRYVPPPPRLVKLPVVELGGGYRFEQRPEVYGQRLK